MKTIPLVREMFEGAVSLERKDGWVKPWRLPFPELRLFPPEEALVNRAETAAGVRLRFETDSSRIAVTVLPCAETGRFDLTIDGALIESIPLAAGRERNGDGYEALGRNFFEVVCGNVRW